MMKGRDALDRLTPLFEPPGQPYESFLRRRDRKRRNQRIAAAALALIIALPAIGGTLALFSSIGREGAASRPSITPQNISRLRLAWTADTGGSGWVPAVAGGVVYTGTYEVGSVGSAHGTPEGRVYAFARDCATGGERCEPLWTAKTASIAGPTVADGVVYAAELNALGPKSSPGRYLYAFATDCGTGGAVCAPLWMGWIGAGVRDMIKPVVVGNTVYVATDTLYAFPVGCRSDGGICAPLWTAPIGSDATVTAMAVAGPVKGGRSERGRVFIGTAAGPNEELGSLRAFSTHCGTGGSTCTPLWKISNIDGVWGLTEDSGVLYVGTSTTLFAIPAYCGGGASCSRLWTAAPKAADGYWLGPVVDGTLFVFDQGFGVYAFPADCGTAGATCHPTWSALVPQLLSSAPPAVADGVVYVGTQTGQVYAFPTACSNPCRPIWSAGEATRDDWVAVTVGDGMVLVASSPVSPIKNALSAYGLAGAPSTAKKGTDHGEAVWFYGALAIIVAAVLAVRLRRRAVSRRP